MTVAVTIAVGDLRVILKPYEVPIEYISYVRLSSGREVERYSCALLIFLAAENL